MLEKILYQFEETNKHVTILQGSQVLSKKVKLSDQKLSRAYKKCRNKTNTRQNIFKILLLKLI